MSGKILLFGFDSLLHVLALEKAVEPFGVELIPVAKTDYHKSLATLAGLDTAPGAAHSGVSVPLGGRMLVLCGLEKELDTLLPVLRQAGAGPECLKAVLTAENRGWNAVTLYGELLREHTKLGGK